MKYLITVLMGFGLLGCGVAVKVTTTKDGTTTTTLTTSSPQVISSAVASDVVSCPSGMTLIPAGTGYGAFCIDTVTHAADLHINALTACASAGKSLCGMQNLVTACAGSNVTAGNSYWASETTSQVGGAVFAMGMSAAGCSAGVVSISGGSPTRNYYCCTH